MSDLNRRPTHRYPKVGRCIYCGATEPPLCDEHVIPFSLGGHLLLPKASCKECEGETHAFEGKTVGTTLRNIRLRYGFPTRHKKQRETHVEIGTIDEQGRPGRAKVPVTEYPVGACFLILAALVLFLGRHHTLTFYNIQQTYIQQMI